MSCKAASFAGAGTARCGAGSASGSGEMRPGLGAPANEAACHRTARTVLTWKRDVGRRASAADNERAAPCAHRLHKCGSGRRRTITFAHARSIRARPDIPAGRGSTHLAALRCRRTTAAAPSWVPQGPPRVQRLRAEQETCRLRPAVTRGRTCAPFARCGSLC